MDVGDRVAAADRPLVVAEALVGQLVDRAGMVEPLPSRRMDGRGDERHPGDDLRLGLDVAVRQELGGRKALGEIEQDAGHFGEPPSVDQQGRHLAFGIDREVVGRLQVAAVERQRPGLERRADLLQRDVHRHRARPRRKIERQHGHLPAT